jgi:hypothetical protein
MRNKCWTGHRSALGCHRPERWTVAQRAPVGSTSNACGDVIVESGLKSGLISIEHDV